MKASRLAIVVIALVALFWPQVQPAAAAGPVGGKDPGSATFLRNGTYPLAANTSVWFKFNYFGDETDVALWIPGAAGRGVKFVVYAPSQISDWWRETPMGRSGDGDDHSAFFTFSSMEGGIYYVRIDNTNPYRAFYQLNLLASSVSLGTAPAEESEPENSTPPPPNADAAGSALVDAKPHTVEGGGTLWYKYPYPRGTLVTVRVPNGNASGLTLNIFSTGQMADWWNEDPLAIGAPTGDDSSDDLAWTGQVGDGEFVYFQLTNPNPWDVTFTLDVSTQTDK